MVRPVPHMTAKARATSVIQRFEMLRLYAVVINGFIAFETGAQSILDITGWRLTNHHPSCTLKKRPAT